MMIDNIEHSHTQTPFESPVSVTLICPNCSEKKTIKFPKTIFAHKKGLSTISVHKGLICEHAFQAFIDKNYKIRGYQKVDLELKSPSKNPENKREYLKDKRLIRNLVCEGNYLKYYPEESFNKIDKNKTHSKLQSSFSADSLEKQKNITLEEIYDDFWDFIGDDNEAFQKFIIRDKRRFQL
jgi:phage pi2 protein 07